MGGTVPFKVGARDEGPVRLLTLERPEKLNAFTAEGYVALTEQLAAASGDEGVAVCVLTGAGRAFSAGVDLSAMGRPGGAAELGRAFDPMLVALAEFEKPLLAAVNGLAVGFGATLLLHCDLVVIDAEAGVRLPFAALGTAAEAASSWLLERRVGPQRAMWMVLSAEAFGADEAVANGFALAKAAPGRAVEDTLVRARGVGLPRGTGPRGQQAPAAPGVGGADRRGVGDREGGHAGPGRAGGSLGLVPDTARLSRPCCSRRLHLPPTAFGARRTRTSRRLRRSSRDPGQGLPSGCRTTCARALRVFVSPLTSLTAVSPTAERH